ncbi:MAG: S8 family serine peptidase [Phaeodactylibacter sp.]|nr:S8 family serine peptidase [Phaeodactylibacter sp.]MCB9302319.1 S8 family serine peptidase [Lewinellaceae bacterium]
MKKTLLLALLFLPLLAWKNEDNDAWKKKVDASLLEKVANGETASFLILMMEQADVSDSRKLKTKTEKGAFVFGRLRQTARQSQAAAIALLEQEKAPYRSFFIVNIIQSKGGMELIRKVAELESVAHVQDNPTVKLEEPMPEEGSLDAIGLRDGLEWGVEKINADDVWAMGYNGQGVVVGGQDTGYEWDHPAIKSKYRGWNGATADHNYNWHDAIHEISPLHGDSTTDPSLNPCGLDSPVPCDDHNHGTHTMGTMVGDESDQAKKIGVAPGAHWIACRNMERGYGSPSTYIECFEWFLAPTDLNNENPDPSKAPHVINNSWSCPELEGCNPSNFVSMQIAVDNLKAAGVVVVVSAGNEGSSCSTVNTPAAMLENSFSIGATMQNDTIAGFSSRGPVLVDGSGRLKPDVAAPGVGVRSCIRNGGFATYSGTSMAGPHVAGLVALIISANPALAGQVEQIETIIEQTARPMLSNQSCGEFSGMEVPNAVYGYGRVDALAAVMAALEVVDDKEVSGGVTVKVLPNPAREQAVIAAEGLEGPAQLRVFALSGQLMYQSAWAPGQAYETINLNNWPVGIYLYRLASGGRTWTGKLAKQ